MYICMYACDLLQHMSSPGHSRLLSSPHRLRSLHQLSCLLYATFSMQMTTELVVMLTLTLGTYIYRPRGRSSIIIPAGGAATTAWGTFRDALSRIEAAGQQVPARLPFPAAFLSKVCLQSHANRMSYTNRMASNCRPGCECVLMLTKPAHE